MTPIHDTCRERAEPPHIDCYEGLQAAGGTSALQFPIRAIALWKMRINSESFTTLPAVINVAGMVTLMALCAH